MSDDDLAQRVHRVQLVPFLFESNTLVRITDWKQHPWFLAGDICRPIGFKNVTQAVKRLDADEKDIIICDTPGGPQEVIVVSESGMYALVLRSHDAMKPGTEAYRFRKWVTAELLPTIRATGRYEMPGHQQYEPAKLEAELSLEMKDKLVNTAARIGGAQAGAEMWMEFNLWDLPSIRYAASRPVQLNLPFEVN